VKSIGESAFANCTTLSSVTIGNSVTNIADYAFAGCIGLKSVYFQGNAPSAGSTVFQSEKNVTVYYLPGTTGWVSTFAGLSTTFWLLPNPLILNAGFGLGVQSNGFDFTISWATNVPVVVEVSTDLASLVWTPLQTNTLTNGSFNFSEPLQRNGRGRYYRISSP
jgi:hypothetical protein